MIRILFLLMILASHLPLTAQNLFAAKARTGQWGFIDQSGKWVVRATFDEAHPFVDGFARVKKGQHWTFVDKQGEFIARFQFMRVEDFQGPVARVKYLQPGRRTPYWGLIDTSGKWVTEPVYPEITRFADNGLAMTKDRSGSWGFINKKGQWVIKPTFGGLRPFSDGLAMAKADGRWGFIDSTGVWIIPAMYEHVLPFRNGKASVRLIGTHWKILDKQNNSFGEGFGEIGKFSEGVARAKKGQWGIIDEKGNWLAKPTFDFMDDFNNGVARARHVTMWGFINKEGQWVIQPTFVDLLEFSEGLAPARKGPLWGYVNIKGEWAVKPTLQDATAFVDGRAVVKVDGKWGIIDTTGLLTTTATFDRILPLKEEEVDEE
jgi:hypothetical protein